MNNTTKAKYDAIRRMVLGKIPAEEIAMIMDVDIKEVQKMVDELEAVNQDAKVMKSDDNYDFNVASLLVDNYVEDSEADANY